ncbi:MAG: serpin family protein [Candidatus Melainabacteria bacterium]|nr:serpin family protein [Candidatus Melainabacteria bacterium]
MKLVRAFLPLALILNSFLPAFAGGTDSFGLDLFKQLSKEKPGENLLMSPYSISTALTMTLNGAGGKTKEAMIDVLKPGKPDLKAIDEEAQAVRSSLASSGGGVILEVANALFARKGITFNKKFLEDNKKYFDASAKTVDFKSKEALGIINGWVSEKTHGKIPTIIDNIPRDAILYLINAIYFKGTWEHQFKKSATIDGDFKLASGKTRAVKMMHAHRDDYPYMENEKFQAINLYYKNRDKSLYLFLPREGSNSLEKFEADLSASSLQGFLERFRVREGSLAMPRFKLEDKRKLKSSLSALGMKIAFDPDRADFKKMASIDENMLIDEVFHKTFMEVNEEGTEAAAVTAVQMARATAMMNPVKPFKMVLDRPFFFVLRDNKTGTVLFLGHVMDPGV